MSVIILKVLKKYRTICHQWNLSVFYTVVTTYIYTSEGARVNLVINIALQLISSFEVYPYVFTQVSVDRGHMINQSNLAMSELVVL